MMRNIRKTNASGMLPIICISCLLVFQAGFEAVAQEFRLNSHFENQSNSEVKASVNQSTGSVSMSIPLLVVESKGMTLPLSLVYNYSGYKINDPASWVGKGWSISGLGSVSRSVNGFPDDKAILAVDLTEQVFEGGRLRHNYSHTGMSDIVETAVLSNKIDFQPDIFSYNSLTSQGTFALNKPVTHPNGTEGIYPLAVQFPYNGDSIRPRLTEHGEPLSRKLEDFRIYDGGGNVYQYNEIEYSRIDAGNNQPCAPSTLPEQYANPAYTGYFVSNWLMTSAHNSIGQESFSMLYSDDETINIYMPNVSEQDYKPIFPCTDVYRHDKKYIERINFENGYILFERSTTDRPDLPDHQSLDRITVFKDGITEPVRTISFEYDRFECCSTGYDRSLRLNSITIENSENELVNEYSFVYYGGDFDDITLNELVVAKDIWGFLNGATNNTNVLPKPENNVEPNIDYIIYGALRRVDNLTIGSSTEILYELNEFSKYGTGELVQSTSYPTGRRKGPGLRVKSMLNIDNNGFETKHNYFYNSFANPSLSSGVLVDPIVHEVLWEKYAGSASVETIQTLNWRSIFEGSFSGEAPLIYTNVEATQSKRQIIDNQPVWDEAGAIELGRVLNWYTFEPNEGAYAQPYAPVFRPYWRRGLPKRTVIMNSTDTLRVTENIYEHVERDEQVNGFKNSRLIMLNVDQEDMPGSFFSGASTDYEWKSEVFRQKKSINKTFIDSPNNFNQTITEYFYEVGEPLQPSKTESIDSDNIKYTVRNKYFSDYDEIGGVVAGNTSAAIDIYHNNIPKQVYPNRLIESATFIEKPGEVERLISSSLNFYKVHYFADVDNQSGANSYLVENRVSQLQAPLGNYIMSDEMSGGYTWPYVLEFDESVFPISNTTLTQFNSDLAPIEIEEQQLIISATHLHPVEKWSVAKIENGKLSESRYTSFEDSYHGGWAPMEDYTTVTTGPSYAASGDHYYRLDGNSFNSKPAGQPNNTFGSGTYLLSYYSTGGETVVGSGSNIFLSESSKVVGEWIYNEKVIKWTTEGNWITISGTGFLDELRLHEIDAIMTTQGYYPDGKLKYEVSPNGHVVSYEYDEKGRLEWVLDTERKALQNHEYGEKNIADEGSFNSHTTLTARREEMTKAELTGNDADFLFKSKRVIYTDGFGRHRQTVNAKATFNGKDVIAFSEYDGFGRALKKYLPYVVGHNDGTHGPFRPNFENEQAAYYNNDSDIETTEYPFSEVELEASPLQRPIEQGGVGETFQLEGGHNVEMEYGWNTTNEVRKWTYSHTTGKVSASGYYPAGVLQCVRTTDQNGIESAQWTDARGRTVAHGAKVRVTGSDFNTTTAGGPATDYQISYSVYDDFGRVVMEISAYANAKMPTLNFEINPLTTLHKELLSWYKYDAKGRVIEKHSPGLLGATHYVYNKYDQLVMSQTYAQRITNPKRWTFSKYDSRHRVILSGECVNSATRATLQSQVDADPDWNEAKASSGGVFGYTNHAIPSITEADVFNAYFFDDYDFDNGTLDFTAFDGFVATEMTRGMPTGSKTRVFMDGGAPTDFLTTVSYYDDKGRPLQAYTENHKGGYDRIDTWYNEFGQVDKTKQTHFYESMSDAVEYTTSYNYHPRTGQLKDTYVTVNDDSQVLVSQKYYKTNGSLSSNKLHKRMGPTTGGSNFMQVLTYRYNERGQLTHINNPSLIVDAYNFEDYDVFGQEITYESHSLDEYDNQLSEWNVIPQYNGNISSMIWNTKDPDADGAMEQKHAYVYRYDDLGNMVAGLYAADAAATPGTFDQKVNDYSELVKYNIGGNIKEFDRFRELVPGAGGSGQEIDKLVYTYNNNGYKLRSVNDAAVDGHIPNVKHFIDGSSVSSQYLYDASGKIINDRNRKTSMTYNRIHLPSTITPYGLPGDNQIKYMYDAAGNKLQKYVKMDDCDPATGLPCNGITETTFDYIGNFVYENGELKMIYHPEGVIRPTPPSAENDTEFVFDYFIKDYLGNVRVVMTEEDATYTDKFLATLEDVHAYIEEVNFENLEEVREDLPTGYPVNGSVSLNERIALLNAANGTEIGPSIVLPVKQGEKVSLSTEYFYTEDAAGATYDNIDFLINEVLIAFAAGGSGILPLNETQLIDIASGQGNYSNALANLFNNEIDTTDMSRPYAYMVWTAYDANLNVIPGASGIERVSDPNDLEVLIREEIAIAADGFLHAYVSNGSAVGVNFDNFQVTTMRGKVRQINHYYPYGLTISGIGTNSDEYLNKYTTKELQTGEWNPALSNGLEMYDFHARHYDPQLGRWFAPDPAEQFSNPYLAMGNNPVVYVDPDGEFIFLAIGFVVGAYIGGTMANDHGNPANWNWDKPAETIAGMLIGGAIGAFGGHALAASKAGAMSAGMAASGKGAAAKSATIFGKTMTQAAGKKYFGATVGGMVNSISEYDGQDSFGWGTLADFGAGFAGAYAGGHFDSNFMGFMVGGTANTMSQGFQNMGNDDYSGYNVAQSFVGGGLSGMVGSGFGGVKGKGVFAGKTKLGKSANSFLKYGSQSTASDFAYSSQNDFWEARSPLDHLGMFAAGGFFGTLGAEAFKGKWGSGGAGDIPKWWRSLTGVTAFATDYSISALIKGRAYGNFYSGQSQKNKGGILGLKYSAFSLNYLGY